EPKETLTIRLGHRWYVLVACCLDAPEHHRPPASSLAQPARRLMCILACSNNERIEEAAQRRFERHLQSRWRAHDLRYDANDGWLVWVVGLDERPCTVAEILHSATPFFEQRQSVGATSSLALAVANRGAELLQLLLGFGDRTSYLLALANQ